jgi:uncharacterized membrane protein YdbT with pleckstrin-like domain
MPGVAMSYAQSVLQPGETIVASGRLHWIIFGRAILVFIVGALVLGAEHLYWPHDLLIAATAIAFGALFLALFFHAWFTRWITEFAVTDKRVISKRGFVWRETEEMNMDKVETVDVDQSVLGRILDYGIIRVWGTGGTNEIIVNRIASPIELRHAIIVK